VENFHLYTTLLHFSLSPLEISRVEYQIYTLEKSHDNSSVTFSTLLLTLLFTLEESEGSHWTNCVTAPFDTQLHDHTFEQQQREEKTDSIFSCRMLSSRALNNVQQLDLPFRFSPTPDYDPQTNPQGLISFGMAENVRISLSK